MEAFWKILNLRQTKTMATQRLMENCNNYNNNMDNLMGLSQ